MFCPKRPLQYIYLQCTHYISSSPPSEQLYIRGVNLCCDITQCMPQETKTVVLSLLLFNGVVKGGRRCVACTGNAVSWLPLLPFPQCSPKCPPNVSVLWQHSRSAVLSPPSHLGVIHHSLALSLPFHWEVCWRYHLSVAEMQFWLVVHRAWLMNWHSRHIHQSFLFCLSCFISFFWGTVNSIKRRDCWTWKLNRLRVTLTVVKSEVISFVFEETSASAIIT